MIGKKKPTNPIDHLTATQDFDALVLCVNLLCAAIEVMNETSKLQSQKLASLEEEIRILGASLGTE